MKHLNTIVLLLLCSYFSVNAQEKIRIQGVVLDQYDTKIPYAAVGIPSKNLGTSTTEDGEFSFQIERTYINETLEISSIGFETFKIKIKDYLNLQEKKILLNESITSLDEIVISNTEPKDFVKLAMKSLYDNTINKDHQLKVFYRRFSSEDNKARFLVEHYLKVLDPGPANGAYDGIFIVTGRKSVDYRYLKKKLNIHSMQVIGKRNPIRAGFRIKDYKWDRIGDTSYDGEDILIFEGIDKNNDRKFIKLYIGIETKGIYRVETSDLNQLYIYKKNKDNKLILSYHNRIRYGKIKLNDFQKKILKTNKNATRESYKHEVFVLGIETDSKIIYKPKYELYNIDTGDINVKYNAEFWQSFSLPPDTDFYKKSVKDLESIYGVSLENQFKITNK